MEYDMQTLIGAMERRLEETSTEYHRPLYDQIDWDDRLICIKGAKGTGKTTMILQYLKEHPAEIEKSMYVSLDKLWFATHSPELVAEYLHNMGGTRLFLDEVHYFKQWQTLVKNLYDDFPRLKIVYSGSSILKLNRGAGDLSRRQREYELKGLSFREFIAFEGVNVFRPIAFEEIVANHRAISRGIVSKVTILPLFKKYLKSGYYPFYKTARAAYAERVSNTVAQILENDLPEIEDVAVSTIKKMEKMLMILAASCPQVPTMKDLYRELETDRNQGLKMLYTLERAGLLSLLSSKSAALKNLSRPDKIFCDNPNLMHALVPDANIGTVRETFFLNQLRAAGHKVAYPPRGDFCVDGKYTFEIGGRGKGFDQIAGLPNSFVAFDDAEMGSGNKIPLWLFGFLY